MQIIFSKGYSKYGSARTKTVHGMTKEEREHVRNGTAIVIISGCPKTRDANEVTFRKVIYFNARFYHRVPDADLISHVITSLKTNEV